MVVVMDPLASEEQKRQVEERLAAEYKPHGIDYRRIDGENQTVYALIGPEDRVDFESLSAIDGVFDARPVQENVNYSLVSRAAHEDDIPLRIGKEGNKSVVLGGERPLYICGPCAVESREQMYAVADSVAEWAVHDDYGQYVLRGGAWKPRTTPHSWQGLGEEAVEILSDVSEEFGIPVMTEARKESHCEIIANKLDGIWVGARNMYGQDLLEHAGSLGVPVIVKRHPGASEEEFLNFSQYVISGQNGNSDHKGVLGLCLRGTVPFGSGKSFQRYPADIGSIPGLKRETYAPVVFDVSHSSGDSDFVDAFGRSALGMGADGLMVEVHPDPAGARTDQKQQITPSAFIEFTKDWNTIHAISGNKHDEAGRIQRRYRNVDMVRSF